jgi:AraC family transcriptional activator FtrA
MSRRSFDRHFRAALGMSPKAWLTRQRLQLAQKYLESGAIHMDRIAAQTGFGNALNMRNSFRQLLGISPSQYRSQFAKRTAS